MTLSSLKPSTKPMKRTGFDQSKHKADIKAGEKRLRSKQRAATAEEKSLWGRMANEVGCIACQLDGRFNTHVSIHHIDGRTRPDCHKKVLPLCAPHHQQDDTDEMQRIAVHPNKAQFEVRYGSQYDLLDKVMQQLGVNP